MEYTYKEDIASRTLKHINKAREILGKKPLKRIPKGEHETPLVLNDLGHQYSISCPVAKALKAMVGNTFLIIDGVSEEVQEEIANAWNTRTDPDVGIRMSNPMMEYVRMFDAGDL